MKRGNSIHERIIRISKVTGVPTKKVLDVLFILRSGKAIANNELLGKVGISRNALNQTKELLASILQPSSSKTCLTQEATGNFEGFFNPDYQPEEKLWSFLESGIFNGTVSLLEKYKPLRPSPKREFDQFTATIETTARRVSLLDFFEDIEGKRLLFLGDDDLVSVGIANLRKASEVLVLDIDERILNGISSISKNEELDIQTAAYDIRKPLSTLYSDKFDIIFTDPPYTSEGVRLFLSRAIEALDTSNQSARIYICYGNSDRAKERFLPIYNIFSASGLIVRWIFDKFNRYEGAESIGSTSSLFILDTTPKTKPLILTAYDKPIYTNN